jgi:hypothetical protein
MTVQLPSGNSVFPPRHRRDDISDIKGQQSAPWQGAFWPVSHWWPALLGTRPATIKQKSPEAGMEHSPRALRAAGLSLWEGVSTSGVGDYQDTCIAPQSQLEH